MTLSPASRYPRLGRRGTSQFRRPYGVIGVEYNMSRVQGKDSNLFSELSNANLKEECESCRNIVTCNVCGSSISGFEHIGVRASANHESGIWHYANPCRHRNQLRSRSANAKYCGAPLREERYTLLDTHRGPDL